MLSKNCTNISSEQYMREVVQRDIEQNRYLTDAYLKAIAEQKYPAEFSIPISLQFELTSKCNLRCLHCYNRSAESKTSDAMTVQRWKEVTREIIDMGGIFQCILSGGEPLLLGDHLFEIMDMLHEDGTSFLLISNGHLLDDEVVKKLKKYRFFWIQISIDGATPELHDEIRTEEGSWKKAVKAAMRIAEAGIPLAIAHSTTPKNFLKLRDMTHLAYRLGANSLIAGEIFPSGRGAVNRELLMNNEQRGELWRTIEELNHEFKDKITIKRAMVNRIKLESGMELPNSGAIIRPNGDIRLDCVAPFVMGNVAKNSFKEQWQKYSSLCWKDERVAKYINSINLYDNESMIHSNYLDDDIYL